MAGTRYTDPRVRAVSPADGFDTRMHLHNASVQAAQRGYADFTIVDVDAHHYETESWREIVSYIEDDVLRHFTLSSSVARIGSHTAVLPTQLNNQDVAGRITRYTLRGAEPGEGANRDASIARRAMDAIGIDYQILFPTPMLNLGTHPLAEVESAIARAYAKWVLERMLPSDDSIKTMLYLPFNDPDACIRLVEEFADVPGVVGFMVTAVRFRPVHHNAYMKLYEMLERRNLPLGFHASFNWQERSAEQLNRFLSVHALTFVWYNMVHLTNWVINGLPERFPGLRTIWIESGLAWIPFLMQRLDNEYRMRSSEAPLLTKMPSEYIREMYFTSQPMERPDRLEMLEATFDMINARSQLLYSSDYPHWDFDLPSTIYDLPFLDEKDKRAILGGNACRLFGLPEKDCG